MKVLSLLVVVALLSGAMAGEAPAAPLELLTAKEAAEPNLPISKAGQPGGLHGFYSEKLVPGAPQIIVEKPEQGAGVATPFPVKIRFIPSGGAKINLDSLEIDVLKLIKISLLSRVKPYVSEKGINVPEAKVPPGTYNIRITVADDQGRLGSATRTWLVR
ncbi:MAG: hypothetical protein ACREIF_05365 [Chthoniobacterales bacterium]